MFTIKSISTKLTGAMAAALFSLCVISAIAIYAAHEIQRLGRDLYEHSERTAGLQMRVSVNIERAISEVHAAPSELDLNRLKDSRLRFDELLGQNRRLLAEGFAGADAAASRGAAIISAIAAFEEAAKKVFDLSAAFAQPDAIAILTSRVAPAETAMQDSLRAFQEAAAQDEAAKVVTIQATTTSVSRVVIAFSALMVAGLSTLAYTVVSRGVVRPIVSINKVMMRLADGEPNVEVPHVRRSDEIGDMARSVEVFKQNTLQAARMTAQQDATRAARSRRQDAMDHHTQNFATSVSAVMATLGSSAEEIRRAASAMTEAASGVHESAVDTSSGANNASNDLNSVAGAVEELTSSFQEISRQVSAAATVSRQAVERAEASGGSIRHLSESTGRIGTVVQLINNIAGQTNLLALNATIEAARAGEAGKGFAVVAGEVKALAAQTAKATAEISSQIDTVRRATESTIMAMTEIGGMIGRMDEVSSAVAVAVEQQSATTREIASSIVGVSKATVRTASAMAHVVDTADRAGEASSNVLRAATKIGTETDRLRTEVDLFLGAVRSDAG